MDHELPLADELSAVFARMSGLLLSEETVSSALRLIAELASETISSAIGAGATVIDGQGQRTTAAASDGIVEQADRLQYDIDEGPCLTAWRDRVLVRLDDTATEQRWPRWCAAVQDLGVRATLSAPLTTGDTALGAIKVYSDQASAFDERSGRLLSLFAAQASILVANVQSLASAERLSEQLRDALRSRDLIGTAKGILMASSGVDEETAFAMLVSASQRENKKLRDVADAIVASTARRRR